MSDEHDSWFKDAFGVDLGQSLNKIKDDASAAIGQGTAAVSQVVTGVQGAVEGVIDGVSSAAVGVVKKVAGAVSPSGSAGRGAGGAAGGGTGSFPLGGSVGRGGKNAANDVSAVQAALGIAADGQCGPQTIAAIEAFQRTLGQARPDGRVDAGGGTERALAGGSKKSAAAAAPPAADDDSGGLVGRVLKGAGDLADGLSDLGASAIKGLEGTLDDGALAAQLKSPSYVNNPNAPPVLQGGETASAGDSFFVTGAQKGKLTAQVKEIYAAAAAIDKVATDLEQKGASKYWFDDKQMLQSAKNLHGTASAMIKLGKALDLGDTNKAALGRGSTALDYADNVIKAAEAVGAIRNLSLSTKNLEEKTSEATVNAWADSVGDAFDKAGGLIDYIPKGAIPGFVLEYYKGLFSAPKNYINAFKTMMKVHYGAIDKEAGISGSKHKAEDLGKTGLDWEGDLTDMFAGGYTLPKSKVSEEFMRYMLKHRKSEGLDLFDVTLAVGKGVLTAAIERDLDDEDPAKAKWVAYVGSSR